MALGEWEEFWSDEPVVFTDGHSQPVGDLRPSFGKPERGISPNWYDDFDFFGGAAISTAPPAVYIDHTYQRRTGRPNQ